MEVWRVPILVYVVYWWFLGVYIVYFPRTKFDQVNRFWSSFILVQFQIYSNNHVLAPTKARAVRLKPCKQRRTSIIARVMTTAAGKFRFINKRFQTVDSATDFSSILGLVRVGLRKRKINLSKRSVPFLWGCHKRTNRQPKEPRVAFANWSQRTDYLFMWFINLFFHSWSNRTHNGSTEVPSFVFRHRIWSN